MDAGETAIAHDDDVIARLCAAPDRLNERIDVVMRLHPCAKRGQDLDRLPAQGLFTFALSITKNEVGVSQCLWQTRRHSAEFHRVGARFEYCDDALSSNLRT